MKIDLHCHTIGTKAGEKVIWNKELFFDKLYQNNVKIVAITNHNCFDIDQYNTLINNEFDVQVWPGIEIDVKINDRIKHCIVIVDPEDCYEFYKIVSKEVKNGEGLEIEKIFEMFFEINCIYFLHTDQKDTKRGFNNEERKRFVEKANEKPVIFEVNDLRSASIYANKNLCAFIGSDTKDWNKYPQKEIAKTKFDISNYKNFCRLIKKDPCIIDELMNNKKKYRISIIPFPEDNIKMDLNIHCDINVIFGPKGTGKSEIMKKISEYFKEQNTHTVEYYDSQKDDNDLKLEAYFKQDQIDNLTQEIKIKEFEEKIKIITSKKHQIQNILIKYRKWHETKNSKKFWTSNIDDKNYKFTNKNTLKRILKETSDNIANVFWFVNLNELKDFCFQNKKDIIFLKDFAENYKTKQIETLCNYFVNNLMSKSISSLKKLRQNYNSEKTKPQLGFTDLFLEKKEIWLTSTELSKKFKIVEKQVVKIGEINDKGEIFVELSLSNNYKRIKNESHKDTSSCSNIFNKDDNTSKCNEMVESIEKIKTSVFKDELKTLRENESKLLSIFDEKIPKSWPVFYLFKVVKEDKKFYKLSKGEAKIFILKKYFEKDFDILLLDEPESGLGQKMVNDYLYPALENFWTENKEKAIIISTHDPNLGVRTLPYSIICREKKDRYTTMIGNCFGDKLHNIQNNEETVSWSEKSLEILDGGDFAFGQRGEIYGKM